MSCNDWHFIEQQRIAAEQNQYKTPWWDQHRIMENRPIWGKYYPDGYMDKYLSLSYQPMYLWQSSLLPGSTPIGRVQEITEWLKDNIDNVWEGPIGYMGDWRFRFTDEEDRMAFKLFAT